MIMFISNVFIKMYLLRLNPGENPLEINISLILMSFILNIVLLSLP